MCHTGPLEAFAETGGWLRQCRPGGAIRLLTPGRVVARIGGEAEAVHRAARLRRSGGVELNRCPALREQNGNVVPGEGPAPEELHRVQLVHHERAAEDVLVD